MLISITLLVACGGSGSGGGDTANNALKKIGGDGGDTANNVLKKYEATFYQCDENDKTTLTLAAEGSDRLNVTLAIDVYSGDNCSGSVIASYRWNTPAVLTFLRKTTATMPPVTLLPYSDEVDEVTMSVANVSAQLTGSGVRGNCVNYSYSTQNGSVTGESCFDLAFPSTTQTGALYLTGDNQYLVQFSRENGFLSADGMFSKNKNFNYNMLTLD